MPFVPKDLVLIKGGRFDEFLTDCCKKAAQRKCISTKYAPQHRINHQAVHYLS